MPMKNSKSGTRGPTLPTGTILVLLALSVLQVAAQLKPQINVQTMIADLKNKKVDAAFKYDLPENYCLNGKDPLEMTKKETLAEFTKGPCSPVILVPGHQSTKLMIGIECEKFRENNAEIFDSCGWTTCDPKKIGKGAPEHEYRLWVPAIMSPFSIFEWTSKQAKCFGGIISLSFNPNTTVEDEMFSDHPGLTVTWAGDTNDTRSESKCGRQAAEDILDIPFIETICPSCMGLKRMRVYLEYLGYQSGLTFQVVPYDFRKSVYASDAVYRLKRSIELLSSLVGKKVVIAAHSLGNLITLFTLNQMPQVEKDKHIELYFALTPPYVGTPKAYQTALGGNPDYVFLMSFLGILIEGQRFLVDTHGTLADLTPSFSYELYKNEPWLQEILNRTQFEKDNDPATLKGKEFWENYTKDESRIFKFFPTPLETCSKNLLGRPDGCNMFIADLLKMPSVIIGNRSLYTDFAASEDIMRNYSMKTKHVDEFLNLRNKTKIPELTNPGVPMAISYVSHLATPVQLSYLENPRTKTDKNQFYFPDSTLDDGGDGTVPNYAAVLPGLKWAAEFDRKEEHAKPVKMVEICSVHNQKKSFYDTDFKDKKNSINKNEYIGSNCECLGTKKTKGAGCNHATIPNDRHFLNLFGNAIRTGDFNPEFKNAEFTKLTDDELNQIIELCPQLTLPRKSPRILDLFRKDTEPMMELDENIEEITM